MLLPGHGAAVNSNAAEALQEALSRSRKDIPRVLPAMVKGWRENS